MNVIIQPSALHGSILAPRSKSSMQRACAAALLKKGSTTILHPGVSNDDKAALDIIRKLGATVQYGIDEITIRSAGILPVADEVNCGESGLSIRMFTPIAAMSENALTITGTGSLLTRPMDFFDTVLPYLGVAIESASGKLPLRIKGPLVPTDIEIDGSLSSQFLTGLLMAYSAAGAHDVTITVKELKSKPYIDLTLQVMKDFGMNVPLNRNYEQFYYLAESTDPQPAVSVTYEVEGDWSGGAFLLVAAAISGNVLITGLDPKSTQADKAVLAAIRESGALFEVSEEGFKVGCTPLRAFDFDATDCPDLFPPLVALAAYCKGETRITGVNRLAHKESDRGLTLQQEFGKMGVDIQLDGDLMTIAGGRGVKGAAVSSHHDHRIAMACAVAALRAEGPTIISGAEAINKSYPDFYTHLEAMGALASSSNAAV